MLFSKKKKFFFQNKKFLFFLTFLNTWINTNLYSRYEIRRNDVLEMPNRFEDRKIALGPETLISTIDRLPLVGVISQSSPRKWRTGGGCRIFRSPRRSGQCALNVTLDARSVGGEARREDEGLRIRIGGGGVRRGVEKDVEPRGREWRKER